MFVVVIVVVLVLVIVRVPNTQALAVGVQPIASHGGLEGLERGWGVRVGMHVLAVRVWQRGRG